MRRNCSRAMRRGRTSACRLSRWENLRKILLKLQLRTGRLLKECSNHRPPHQRRNTLWKNLLRNASHGTSSSLCPLCRILAQRVLTSHRLLLHRLQPSLRLLLHRLQPTLRLLTPLCRILGRRRRLLLHRLQPTLRQAPTLLAWRWSYSRDQVAFLMLSSAP